MLFKNEVCIYIDYADYGCRNVYMLHTMRCFEELQGQTRRGVPGTHPPPFHTVSA